MSNKIRTHQITKFRTWFRYGLKAQKLIAQGSALGIHSNQQGACKGKSFVIAGALKAFALTGRQACVHHYPGRCPGLGASALSGRAAQNLLLPLQGVRHKRMRLTDYAY